MQLGKLSIWIAVLLIGGFLSLNSSFVTIWVGGSFYAGEMANTLIVASFVVSTAVSVMSGVCFAAGRIRGNGLIALIQSIIYLPTVWLGANYFGLVGAIAAGLFSVVITQGIYLPRLFAVTFRLKLEDVRQLLREVCNAIAVVIPLVFVFGRFHPPTWTHLVLITSLFTCSYVTLLLLVSSAFRGWILAFLAGCYKFLSDRRNRSSTDG